MVLDSNSISPGHRNFWTCSFKEDSDAWNSLKKQSKLDFGLLLIRSDHTIRPKYVQFLHAGEV